MPWMATLLAALALLCVVRSNRLAEYDELGAPMLARSRSEPKGCSRYLDGHECVEQPEAVETDADQSTSEMLSVLFGLVPSTPATVHPTEAALTPYQLPPMYYNDFYEDLLTSKRSDAHAAGCDCKVKNDLLDLGNGYVPRYLMSAICESRPALTSKCRQGSNCKPLEYKVKVLMRDQPHWLTEQWQFKVVTVTAGCFCTNKPALYPIL